MPQIHKLYFIFESHFFCESVANILPRSKAASNSFY